MPTHFDFDFWYGQFKERQPKIQLLLPTPDYQDALFQQQLDRAT